MANVLETVIKVKDQASTPIKNVTGGLKKTEKQLAKTSKAASGFGSTFKKLGAMFVGGAAIWKMVSFAKESMEAFGKQEQAVIKLNQALKNNDQYSAALSANLQQVASDIQKVTTVGDETTLGMMQLALSMGVGADQMEETIKQTIGLSKAYGVDLNASMKMVALARQGEYTMLNRYIPQLRALKTDTEKAAMTNELLAKGFDVAKAETRTAMGAVEQFTNKWGDFKEKLGAVMAVPFLKYLRDMGVILERTSEKFEKFFPSDEIGKKEKEIKQLKAAMTAASRAIITSGEGELEIAEKLLTAQKELLALKKAIAEPSLEPPLIDPKEDEAAAEKLEKDKEEAQGIIDRARNTEEELTIIKMEALALRLQNTEEGAELEKEIDIQKAEIKKKLEDKQREESKKRNKERLTLFGDTLSKMATLSESGSKEISAIGKAAAIMSAVMDTYVAATKALSSPPGPPWTIPLAATVTGIGLSNVSKIASAEHGGPIKETGPLFAHEGEFMLPKGIVNAIRKGYVPPSVSSGQLAGATAGGGGVTLNLNISGEFIEGDETKWTNLFRDHIVPEIDTYLERTGKEFA